MSGLWVTIIIVAGYLSSDEYPKLLMESSKFITSTVDLVSKSPVGSSNNNTFGQLAKALAIATLYYSPPDNSEGKWSILSYKPTLFNKFWALFRISFSDYFPNILIGNSIFS